MLVDALLILVLTVNDVLVVVEVFNLFIEVLHLHKQIRSDRNQYAYYYSKYLIHIRTLPIHPVYGYDPYANG
jgi:hypothetical protein